MMKHLFALLVILCCGASFAHAQELAAGSKEPLEITADESLEWKRNEKLFIARKNAMAKQGEMALNAQVLTAAYREGPKSDMEIQKVTADGEVVLSSKDSQAFGDQAVYELDKGFAVMTGDNLRMVSPDQVVTAHDRFEYWVADGKLNAIGDAKVVRTNAKGQQDILESDQVSAILKDNGKGQRVLHSLEAIGNVVITTPTETVTGSYGIYHADTNKAELTGSVTIKRGPNILQGEKAEVDMNTNTSRMFGNQSGDGRVRGVFYPGSEKKPDDTP